MTDTSAVARFCASCGNELMPRSTTIQIDGLTYHPRCAESLSQNEADSLRAELDRLRATNAALKNTLGAIWDRCGPEHPDGCPRCIHATALAMAALTPTPAPQPEIGGRGASVLGRATE